MDLRMLTTLSLKYFNRHKTMARGLIGEVALRSLRIIIRDNY